MNVKFSDTQAKSSERTVWVYSHHSLFLLPIFIGPQHITFSILNAIWDIDEFFLRLETLPLVGF